MIKYLSTAAIVVTLMTGCGGSDNDKKSSSSSSLASSSAPASSTPASSTPASSMPASSTPASSMPASSMPASSMPASSVASSVVASSSEAASSSSAAAFDGTFTSANSIDFWTAAPGWQKESTGVLSHSNGAMILTPTWVNAAADSIDLSTTFAAALDLTGATISIDIYLPEAYVVDANLDLQIFFRDSNNKFANGGYKGTAWSAWRYTGSEISTTNMAADNHYGWVTLSYYVIATGVKDSTDAAATPSFGYNEGIDVTKITTFGVEIISGGKPLNVTGDIRIDNVVLPGLQ